MANPIESDTRFNGWAVVELMGHQKEVGFVTTQYYGDKAFQVALPEREEETDRQRWIGDTLAPTGSKVKGEAVPGRSRIFNPTAIYALNPVPRK